MNLSRPHQQAITHGLGPTSGASASTPLARLGQTVGSKGTCRQFSEAYGKCVASNYQAIEKDSCKKEFENFKQCVQQCVGKKW
ncbi:hypothetical protein PCANC_05013 [Puccinia coronata f. sp. avenae]|uniref:Uncharacterized protein n=1 Tax=Puccinia coronata f. sp. avenae TaxID=200324 RepID=A0A2N5T7L6_9BASI|nr:hypothetical protein PCANC_05013 [Puccinia coronata f. sp. avenae]PLW45831.1 hypothetical protein PCASD_04785 [Puccinia coronata f. sp. avenae]